PVGVANIEAIASTPGVDLLWVGHYDLSQSMGIPAQFDHPDFRQALRAVIDAANLHGKIAAIQPGDLRQAETWYRLGFRVLSWKTDIALYRAALQKELQELRRVTIEARA